jgi:hypothetical protein
MLESILARLRKVDVALNAIGLLLGIFLAAATLLKAADWPEKQSWQPWTGLFIVLLCAAVYVPLFGFYKYLDTRQAREEVWLRDVNTTCQEITYEIGRHCPTVTVGDVAVSFWRCLSDGTFDRRGRFLLAGTRQMSGVAWRRGRGVAGWLWDHLEEGGVTHKLERVNRMVQQRNGMGKEEFNQLPYDERLGLTYHEWRALSRYTGVVAVPEYQGENQLVGILVVDYVGHLRGDDVWGDQIDQIERAVRNDADIAKLRGTLVERLKTRV